MDTSEYVAEMLKFNSKNCECPMCNNIDQVFIEHLNELYNRREKYIVQSAKKEIKLIKEIYDKYSFYEKEKINEYLNKLEKKYGIK